MKTNQPVCKTVLPWLKANLGPRCLGCLTGQSGRALAAAVQLIDLYSSCDYRAEPHVLVAFRNVVETMAAPERELAYHAIAHVLDWSDRDKIWHLANLPTLVSVSACAYGPGGKIPDSAG
jgi:hypothetical protein